MRELKRTIKFHIVRDEGVGERQKVFVEKERELKSFREDEEMKKMNKKKIKWLVTVGKIKKWERCQVAKLHVI